MFQKTIEEYKVAAEKLKEKYPDKYAGVFAGKRRVGDG
mgnify:FL=1